MSVCIVVGIGVVAVVITVSLLDDFSSVVITVGNGDRHFALVLNVTITTQEAKPRDRSVSSMYRLYSIILTYVSLTDNSLKLNFLSAPNATHELT